MKFTTRRAEELFSVKGDFSVKERDYKMQCLILKWILIREKKTYKGIIEQLEKYENALHIP